jgi:hypothetical protein
LAYEIYTLLLTESFGFRLALSGFLFTTSFCMESCVLNERHFSAGEIEFIKNATNFD